MDSNFDKFLLLTFGHSSLLFPILGATGHCLVPLEMALPAWQLLKGKTAAITGGTTGIGRAIALEFIRQGCNVAINHLELEKDEPLRYSLLDEVRVLQQCARNEEMRKLQIKVLAIAGDVTVPDTSSTLVKQAVDRWGKLDIFVANAGVFKQAEFLE
jgi:NAD(P)-dependent dehydrogenase (short-subunit alcohol dehydrogenase family)